MDPLDGNAIAGTLVDVFGREMTMDIGTCARCGRRMRLAEVAVFLSAPGVVARCPHCDFVLLVITDRRGTRCVDMSGFTSLEQATPELT